MVKQRRKIIGRTIEYEFTSWFDGHGIIRYPILERMITTYSDGSRVIREKPLAEMQPPLPGPAAIH